MGLMQSKKCDTCYAYENYLKRTINTYHDFHCMYDDNFLRKEYDDAMIAYDIWVKFKK